MEFLGDEVDIVKTLIVLIQGMVFLLIGISVLLCPRKIQRKALNYYETHKTMAMLNPFPGWMKTRSYIVSLQITAVIAIVIAIVEFYLLIKEALK